MSLATLITADILRGIVRITEWLIIVLTLMAWAVRAFDER